MAYTTTAKIKSLGFSFHNFDVVDDVAFDALITTTLDEQTTLIKIDCPQYDTATQTEQLILSEAEKFRTAAALKRIQAAQTATDAYRELSGQPAEPGENLYKVAQQFDNRADIWLGKIGVAKNMVNEAGGIASAVVVS